MRYIKIMQSGYIDWNDQNGTYAAINYAPHTAQDGTTPDGMRKPRWIGTWSDVNQLWVDGGWVDDEASQLDTDLVNQNIAAIKAKAGEIITARLPEWKQRNLLARKSELQDKTMGGATLSAEEQAEWDWMITEWAWCKSVRTVSDQAELNNTPVGDVVWLS